MGKVLKPLLLIAAVAVNVIPGVGQALSTAAFSALGAGFVSAGLATAVGAGLTAALGAGLAAAGGAFKTRAASAASLSRLTLSFNPEADRKIVFGETAMATDVLYQEASGTDQEFIDIIVAVAAHKVDAITEIYSEDKLMWSSAGGVASGYTGYLTVDIVTEGTRTNGIPINGGSIWNSDCTLTGCAYVKLRVKRTGATSKASSPFAAGIPGRMTIKGRGMPVYDPRRDSTVGGSGSHRANNQATWQYADGATPLGNNHALQTLTYLLGWKVGGVLSVGAGVPPARLAMADWIAAANVCDEAVSLASGGSHRRYEGAGVFGDGDAPTTVLEVQCRHMNANLRDTGGKIGIRMAINDTAGDLVTFTEDDLQGGYDWQPCSALQDSYNVVRGKWTDPSTASLYQMVPYPAQSVTAPDGINRPVQIDLPMVQDATRAQRIARQILMRGQYKGTFSAIFGPRAWACEVGQPVRLTLPAIGASAKLFRVVSQELKVINSDGDAQAVCPMTLVEEDPAIYAWSSGDASAVAAAVAPVSYLPSSQPFLLGDLADLNATEGAKLAGIAPGADVTAANTAANSNALGGTPAATVASNISTAATTATWPNVTGTGRPADNADVTASVLPALLLPAAPVIRADFTGAVLAGQLNRVVKATRTRGGTDVSSTTTWSIQTFGCTANISSNGTITITACSTTGRIIVTSVRDSFTIVDEFAVVKELGAPPATGGAGATSASDSSIASITANTYGGEQAGPLTVTAGSGGTVTLSAPLSFSSAAAVSTRGKWRWRIVGGFYADVATEISSTSAAVAGEPDTGYIEVSQSQTGLSPGSAYEFILQLRRASGSGTVDFSGTASAVAS